MKIKQSQKNIPDGWISKTLGDFLEKVEGGGTPSKERPDFWSGSIPWASVKDVVTHNPYDTQDHISEEGLHNSSSRIIPRGTLIVPTRMALGHVVVFGVDVAINQDLKALYPKKELLDKFLFYWFKSKKEFIERLGSGSTVSGIQQNELKAIKFLLPPISDQKRIVSVLETLELVIEKLANKIKVKKNIKKGLMQNILTGKIRLRGFKDDWRVVKLGSIAKVIMGQSPSSSAYNENKKGLPLVQGNNDIKKGITMNRIWTTEITKTVDHETIIMTVRAPVGSIGVASGKICIGRGVCGIIPEKVNRDFLLKFLEKCDSTWRSLEQGSTFSAISGTDIKNLEINVPTSTKEQNAIADIIVTVDKEIEALDKKLAVLKDQRRYLLNNLITGTIRTKA